jgi:hypothetical protein
MKEALSYSETSVLTKATRRNIPEGIILEVFCCFLHHLIPNLRPCYYGLIPNGPALAISDSHRTLSMSWNVCRCSRLSNDGSNMAIDIIIAIIHSQAFYLKHRFIGLVCIVRLRTKGHGVCFFVLSISRFCLHHQGTTKTTKSYLSIWRPIIQESAIRTRF